MLDLSETTGFLIKPAKSSTFCQKSATQIQHVFLPQVLHDDFPWLPSRMLTGSKPDWTYMLNNSRKQFGITFVWCEFLLLLVLARSILVECSALEL